MTKYSEGTRDGTPRNGALTLTEYQQRAATTAKNSAQSPYYLVPALAGEVGELAEIFAKAERDKNGYVRGDDIDRIGKEIGDVLWMLAELATIYELSLAAIARANLAKLADRQQRGVIGGSGDDR